MPTSREIKVEEVRAHNKPDDLWVIISGKVYDLSKFRHEHPGGSDVLEDVAGRDATHEFIEVGHSKEAEDQMKSYLIGSLIGGEKCGLFEKKCMIAAGALLAGIAVAFIFKRIITGSN